MQDLCYNECISLLWKVGTMKIIFIRHGKDDDQYRGGWSSHDLLPEGVQQAKLLAQHLKTHQSDYQIAEIISSDLKRTMTTAKYIADALALSIQKEPMLRETNNGVLAGMLNTDASAQYPGLFFSTLKMDERYPGGESPNEFYQRIKLWFSDFCKKQLKYVFLCAIIYYRKHLERSK